MAFVLVLHWREQGEDKPRGTLTHGKIIEHLLNDHTINSVEYLATCTFGVMILLRLCNDCLLGLNGSKTSYRCTAYYTTKSLSCCKIKMRRVDPGSRSLRRPLIRPKDHDTHASCRTHESDRLLQGYTTRPAKR